MMDHNKMYHLRRPIILPEVVELPNSMFDLNHPYQSKLHKEVGNTYYLDMYPNELCLNANNVKPKLQSCHEVYPKELLELEKKQSMVLKKLRYFRNKMEVLLEHQPVSSSVVGLDLYPGILDHETEVSDKEGLVRVIDSLRAHLCGANSLREQEVKTGQEVSLRYLSDLRNAVLLMQNKYMVEKVSSHQTDLWHQQDMVVSVIDSLKHLLMLYINSLEEQSESLERSSELLLTQLRTVKKMQEKVATKPENVHQVGLHKQKETIVEVIDFMRNLLLKTEHHSLQLQQKGISTDVLLDQLCFLKGQLQAVASISKSLQNFTDLSRHEAVVEVIDSLIVLLKTDVNSLQWNQKAGHELTIVPYESEVLEIIAGLDLDCIHQELISDLPVCNCYQKTGVIHDVVISANPDTPPYSLIAVTTILQKCGLNVLLSSKVHSSINGVRKEIAQLFQNGNINQRSEHDIAFTVLWKNLSVPSLMVNPVNHHLIAGEGNILRYISRVVPGASALLYESSLDISQISTIDYWLDDIEHILAQGSSREKHSFLKQLNSRLDSSPWLCGNLLTVADVFACSVILQLNMEDSLLPKLKVWFINIKNAIGLNWGLYGERGLLPAHTQLPQKNDPLQCFNEKKTLLCFSSFVGLNTVYMMELISLIGTILSFIGFVWKIWCTSLLFVVLWGLYLSLYQVGQIFLWYQWDILLLEIGFLAIFVAPLSLNYRQSYHPRDLVTMWIVRWALFRLMFASGVVKLQSNCPTWWGLTALGIHYESQCIPTPLAWYVHQMPDWWHKLCIVVTYIIEIATPFFFFSPIREHRLFAFRCQVFLQVIIFLTGNYNFFNLTTLAMCFSLLDDYYLGYIREYGKHTGIFASFKNILKLLLRYLGYGTLAYLSYVYFGLTVSKSGIVDSKITFSKAQFTAWMENAVPLTIGLGTCSLLLTIAEALTSSLFEVRGTFRKAMSFGSTLLYAFIVAALFGVSLVPYTVLDDKTNARVFPLLKKLHSQTSGLQITSSYGLFRRMTGINGRPEVILEGANDLEGPWTAYEFTAKPGRLNRPPPFVAPHQPRVDWQMWFAALGTYHQNPWLISMTHRLLSGYPEVTKFLDRESPWKDKPPTYIRGLKFTYSFTSYNDTSGNWWKRKSEGEYLPVFSATHTPLLDYLKKLSYIGTSDEGLTCKSCAGALDLVRSFAEVTEPRVLLWSLFLAALIIIFTKERSLP